MSSSKSGDPAFAAALDRLLTESFPAIGDAARAKMLEHYRLLAQWNRKLNLTRVIDPSEAARKHFGESLFLAEHLPDGVRTVVDVGSGPGFPGLPIAAARPDVEVTCVESIGKKAAFLREVSRGWGNVKVIDRRIEAVAANNAGEPFDWAVMRAVAIEPLLGKLAQIAKNLAILAAEDAAETLEASPSWNLTMKRPLPWEGFGVLLIADRL